MNQHEWLRIWNGMTPEKRDYDRFVAKRIPPGASREPETIGGQRMLEALDGRGRESRYPEGCSCHTCAPCSFCERLTEDQADRLWNNEATSDQIIEEWRGMDDQAELSGQKLRMVEENSKFVPRDLFDSLVDDLGKSSVHVRRLLNIKPWHDWPAHLQKELFDKIGKFPDGYSAESQS